MNTRRKSRKVDPKRGDRPYIGYRADGKQQRFTLGLDPVQAKLREDRIRKLYEESCQVRWTYGLPMNWTEAGLHAAKHLASGGEYVPIPHHSVINEAAGKAHWIGGYDHDWEESSPNALLWSMSVASRQYPSIKWLLPEGEIGTNARSLANLKFTLAAKQAKNVLGLDKPPHKPVVGRFHQHLDQYAKYLEVKLPGTMQKGSISNRIGHLKLLKRHEDFPLHTLDFAKCQEIISFWASRPTTTKETTKRYSGKTARQIVAELYRFFEWLEFPSDTGWEKPKHFEKIDATVHRDHEVKSIRELTQKPTFRLDELIAINKECDAKNRMLLYVGLNCSFGAGELGRLEIDDISLRQKNPLEHYWHSQDYKSEPTESWIARLRNKTGVAGCWWLFPETVHAIQAWLELRPETTERRLVVTGAGTSLYRDDSKNGQSGFANHWSVLLRRVAKNNPELKVRILPFGTLRDQFPDWATAHGESEASSIALAHGCPFNDNLLECYANRPFPRLFAVQKRYHEFLRPLFDAVK
jgi:integrase